MEVRKIKAIVYGLGAMGKIATRLMIEKEVNIVGAVGHVSNIGKDVGEIAGLGYPLNVILRDDADEVLSQQEADIAVLSAGAGDMASMYPHFKKCIEHGLNVITIAEEALYPWRSYPEMTAELDGLAKKHGVTVTASGVQDIFWVNLVAVLTGACHKIVSIKGETTANVDDYGPVVAEESHLGETLEEYSQKAEKQKITTTRPFKIGLEALIADLGLTVSKTGQRSEPITSNIEVWSKSLSRTIKKGQIIGMAQIDEVETEQGIKFQGTFTGKIFQKGDTEINSWIIMGEPDLYLENKHMPGQLATCTQMVNRIPDVINSEPGFVTIEKLPKPKYRAYPLYYYLKDNQEFIKSHQ